MVRSVLAQGFLILGLLTLASSSRADFFDGSGGGAPQIPKVDKAALSAMTAQAAAAAAPRRPSSDLYYFTKEEAAAAKKKFGFRPDAHGWTFDSDVPAAIQAQMRADLAFIYGLKGGKGTPLHQKIFGAMDGAAYRKFFESRVSAIGMDDCGNGNAVACVIPFQNPSKMWLTQNFIKFSHPQVSRMMVVFHEARHTETRNGNWPHATCPTPFLDESGNDMKSIWTGALLAGEPACDETPLGSYGSSTIMLKNIQKFCTNCTDKVKQDAGLYADDQMGRIIDDGAKKEMLDDFAK
ncbi:MAG: hypothetical protein KGJ84_03640 [Elusimicrobia bacterium]|nr:hypothetical protein [Elusimicrobiota bacterium]